MPTLQVIDRKVDPMVGIIQQGTAQLNDVLYKKQALALSRDELKLKSKSAKTEIEKLKFSKKKSYDRYPEKIKARTLVCCALKTGFLIRPNICSKCQKESRIEAHHPDYSKPLEVMWLCKKCHMAEHRKEKPINRST